MRLFATVLITLIITAFVALFVWGWYAQGKIIPEVIFGGLLTLVASLVSFMWLRNPREHKETRNHEERKRPPSEWF
jgi:uncharacterized membrane protein